MQTILPDFRRLESFTEFFDHRCKKERKKKKRKSLAHILFILLKILSEWKCLTWNLKNRLKMGVFEISLFSLLGKMSK